jgi:hypothetical protein
MFSGGEKKSFYELSVVIGIIVTALESKQIDSKRAKMPFFAIFLFLR